MNELALITKASTAILTEVAPKLAEAAPILIEAIKTYGCRNQVAITQMVSSAFPEFVKYSEIVLSKLNQAISIATKTETENYDLVIQTVLNDSLATLDEKVAYIMIINKSEIEVEHSRTDNFIKRLAAIATSVFALVGISSAAAVRIIKALAESTVKVSEAQNAGKFWYQILKLFRRV